MAYFLLILLAIVCVLLVLVVLVQKGRGGGLGSAFGGGAGSSAFGTRTGDVFTWITIVLTVLFLVLTVLAVIAVRPDKTQVSDPILDPASIAKGTEGKKIITVKTTTKGTVIRYTINEPEITEKSTQYDKRAISIYPGDTLRVKAFRSGKLPSNVVTLKYEKAEKKSATTKPAKPAKVEEVKSPATKPAKAAAPKPATPAPAK